MYMHTYWIHSNTYLHTQGLTNSHYKFLNCLQLFLVVRVLQYHQYLLVDPSISICIYVVDFYMT